MPRKFKIGGGVPPVQRHRHLQPGPRLRSPASASGKLEWLQRRRSAAAWARTDRAPETYPRIGDVIGLHPPPTRPIATLDGGGHGVQRDYGDRVDRAHARFKYTIDDQGPRGFSQGREIERAPGVRPGAGQARSSSRRTGDQLRLDQRRKRPGALHALHRRAAA